MCNSCLNLRQIVFIKMRYLPILCLCLVTLGVAKPLYNTLKSYVNPVTVLNFEKQVNKIRQTTKYVTVVHFYKANDGESANFAKKYDEFTTEFRGVFRLMFCDCDENAKLCEKENIQKFPTLRIYPPVPIPLYDYEGPLDTKELMQAAAKYLGSNVVEITPDNINTFITENPSVPKALLFSEKKGFPMIYKGLSVEFEKKITFGIVRSNWTTLVDRYNVKTFPKFIVIKTNEKKPIPYNGEFKFLPMFEFLNIYSEVFVPGGGSAADSAATKNWLTELVPELHQKSANDICLKVDSVICVILLNAGDKPDNALVDELKELHNRYQRHINRGNVYKFMWLNTVREKKWAEMFNFSGQPKVVMLNPGRRKRYVAHEGALKGDAIEQTLERINGGDAKFEKIGDTLPDFAAIN